MKFANNKDVFVSYFLHTKDNSEHEVQFQFDGWDKELMLSKYEEFMRTLGFIKKDEQLVVKKITKKEKEAAQ
jgi:hypothetical protein